ncbi:MAG: glycoside hydrolase family 88 protein, partial [Phycisphaerae bacterium]|nr:glycoside hydrolase family 88 protein [Phycisphaerae bacterium]
MMKRTTLTTVIVIGLLLSFVSFLKAEETGLDPASIKAVMKKVADWQLAHPSKHDTTDWTHGALFAGMTAWAQMAGNETYDNALLGFGEKNNWQPHKRENNVYHADDHAVAQMYIEMYKKHKDPKMIGPIQKLYDHILAHQPNTPLTHDNREHKKRYNWCDALFMAPPVWAKLARITGEQKYLDYMNKEFWATTDYLFDTEEDLYFRDDRYFKKREANGEKVFWSRGNGWVMGGLVRVLEEMPDDYPDRVKYEALYKKMAARIMKIQPAEGMWHSSLLDPETFGTKEASGSGFYCYALAWGVNQGLLDAKTYRPAVEKAWVELVRCVHPDGKLGNVQPIGADPRKVTDDQTEVYGVGAFLLAGSEVCKIAMRDGGPVRKIIVENPTLSFRDSQTVSLDWKDVKKTVAGLAKDNVAVLEFKTNRLLLTQIVEDGPSSTLLFQADFAPGEKKYFWIMKQPAAMEKPASKIATFCRFVPEREDDFAWENDLIAFRMYGPGLWKDAVNSGVDCWFKRVPYPIINKWYGQMKEKTYHKDWGEGYDPYHVGKTTGCGGVRIVENGKYLHSNVYDQWKVIANGPIRSIFELTYDKSWKASGKKLIETKRVTIDLGQRLCRFDCTFDGPDAAGIKQFAVGVTTHDSKAKSFYDIDKGLAGCWEEIDGSGVGTAVLVASPAVSDSDHVVSKKKDEGHIYLIAEKGSRPLTTYYVGYGWEKAGAIKTMPLWRAYLNDFKDRIDNPVTVRFADSPIVDIPLKQVRAALGQTPRSHPRLFLSDAELAGIKNKISASAELKILHKAIIGQADGLIGKKPVERKKIGRRLLSVSRNALQRIFNLSWAYRSTGDEKYLKRAEQEMLAIANFTDWNPSHFLDVAEMTMAMAIGYDWLYNGLSVESRKVIRKAIIEMGIQKSLDGKSYNWWVKSNINWNQVCHAGMTCGALAVMEDEPELAETVVHRSVNKVQLAMEEYEPDGAYPEGPGYWVYGTTYNVILIEALDSVLGTDFGLSEKNGFAKSGAYYLHATGPTGLYFNYADCGSKG